MFEHRDSQDSFNPSTSSSSSTQRSESQRSESQRKLVPYLSLPLSSYAYPTLSLSLSLLWAVERSGGGGGLPFFGLGIDYNSAYSRVQFYETELDSVEDVGSSRNRLKDPVDEQVSRRSYPTHPLKTILRPSAASLSIELDCWQQSLRGRTRSHAVDVAVAAANAAQSERERQIEEDTERERGDRESAARSKLIDARRHR